MTLKPGWLFFLPWSLESVGGVNRVVVELCREMHRQGEYHPFIMIDSWEDSHARIVDKDFYTEIHYRIREPLTESNTVKASLLFLAYLPTELIRLRLMFKKYNIQVLNPHYFTLSASLLAVYRYVFGRSVKILASLHGADLLAIEASPPSKRFVYLAMLRRMDQVVTCSNGLKKKAAKLGEGLRLHAIPNGFSDDVSRSTPIEDAGPTLPKSPYILSVATFENKKGLDVLIAAYYRLTPENPELELVLVGRSGPALREIQVQIEKLCLQSRVHIFTDVFPHTMAAFYQHALMFVLPSRYEPFGIVLLEAAVNRVPVISTRTMGGGEIISDGENGLLVDIEDQTALQLAIEQFINDPVMAERLSESLYSKVVVTYTWERACDAYIALFKDAFYGV